MFKVLFIFIIAINILYASNKNDDAKFIVLDNATYAKLEISNILNGGIKKRYLINSSRLSALDLKNYYPEYYLYNAEECFIINSLFIGKKDIKVEYEFLTDKKEIKKEIKKVKLLQMLSDDDLKSTVSHNVSPRIIKSIGYICSDKLIFKNNSYKVEDNIGNFIIKTIDSKNYYIKLEVK